MTKENWITTHKDEDSDGTSDKSSDDSDPGFDVNPVYKSSAKLSIVNH